MKYHGFIRENKATAIISETNSAANIDRVSCVVTYQENDEEKTISIYNKKISKLIPDNILKVIKNQNDFTVLDYCVEFEVPLFLCDSVTIKSVKFFSESKWHNALIEIDAINEKFSLMHLCPLDEKQASESLWFKSSRSRHPDPETLSIVAKNVFENKSLENFCRVNAFVVFIYKSIELERVVSLDAISTIYNEMSKLCESIGRAHSSKRDGKLLKLSLMTAIWHFYVDRGERVLALDVIDALITEDYSTEETPLFALNFSCALLFKCITNVRTNEFLKDAERLIDLFYYAVSIKADNSGWFVDYRSIHEKSLVAMQMKESFKDKGFVEEQLINKAIKLCFRVSEKTFFQKAVAVFEAVK